MWDNLEVKPTEEPNDARPLVAPKEEIASDTRIEIDTDCSQAFSKSVFDSVRAAMEEMVFQPVDRCLLVVAELPVLKPVEANLRLVMPEPRARRLTEAVLACSPQELNKQMVCDAIAEIANTVVGRLLVDVLSVDKTFKLGLPHVRVCYEIDHLPGARSVFFHLEDQDFCIMIVGDELIRLCEEAAT